MSHALPRMTISASLGDYESRRTSSYDRSGGNDDHGTLKPGATLELFAEARRDPRWFNTSGEGNYVFLETRGDGHFVGVTLSVFQNQWGGWNEGDEMIWIDGEPAARIHGTGGPGQDRKMK
ncbi:MAG: DUF2961 domain-containing protein [Acidobacteriia bacterium]|nr:DUF2961 domain-containing protein [Terriglobia bacterium]